MELLGQIFGVVLLAFLNVFISDLIFYARYLFSFNYYSDIDYIITIPISSLIIAWIGYFIWEPKFDEYYFFTIYFLVSAYLLPILIKTINNIIGFKKAGLSRGNASFSIDFSDLKLPLWRGRPLWAVLSCAFLYILLLNKQSFVEQNGIENYQIEQFYLIRYVPFILTGEILYKLFFVIIGNLIANNKLYVYSLLNWSNKWLYSIRWLIVFLIISICAIQNHIVIISINLINLLITYTIGKNKNIRQSELISS